MQLVHFPVAMCKDVQIVLSIRWAFHYYLSIANFQMHRKVVMETDEEQEEGFFPMSEEDREYEDSVDKAQEYTVCRQ